MRFVDESELGFGWIEEDVMARTSHAIVADGGVWLVDPVAWDDAERRAGELGELRGVIQLLDRHARDSAAIAQRLGIAHHRVPRDRLDDAPFEFLPIAGSRFWDEVALWWPEERLLVCADALGTLPYFRSRGERLGLHPFLRLWPPRALRRVFPERILCGHGRAIEEGAADALHESVRTARRRLLPAVVHGARRVLAKRKGR